MNRIDELLRVVTSAHGSEPDVHAREHAADELVAIAAEARPRVLELLAREPTRESAPLAELAARLGGAESVPLLARLLHAPQLPVRVAAARALAAHPESAGARALLEALASRDADAVVAAADAVTDPAACVRLEQAAAHPDATVRYHVISAALRLGCGWAAQRAAADHDPDVQALAR